MLHYFETIIIQLKISMHLIKAKDSHQFHKDLFLAHFCSFHIFKQLAIKKLLSDKKIMNKKTKGL